MKPGSCGPGVLGVYPVIYDEDGNEVPAGSGKAGNICIRNPWPGIFQTIWGQPERFVDTYYRKYNKDPDSKDWRDWPYFAGDGAVQARRRLLPDPRPGRRRDQRCRAPARDQGDRVRRADRPRGRRGGRGPGYRRHPRPRRGDLCLAQARLRAGPTRWKTRSARRSRPRSARSPGRRTSGSSPTCRRPGPGKIMRRVIASISNFADVGDVTTLANPEVVEEHPAPRAEREGRQRTTCRAS